MTIAADQNEARNQVELVNYLQQSVPVTIGSYNETSGSPIIYPDFTIWGGSKLVGVNRKTWGEVCSSIDRVEDQLLRELAGPCEQIALIVEGIVVPDGLGGCWVYNLDFAQGLKLFRNTDAMGTVLFKRQHYRSNYEGIRNWLTRLEWLGIQVIPTQSTYDTAINLVAMHNLVLKDEESKTLNRLIKEKFTIIALDPVEKAMATSLMGLANGRAGEELALSLARHFNYVVDLIRYWDEGNSIAELPMKSGKRKVGHAAESNLKAALGYRSPDPKPIEQGAEAGLLLNT